MENNTEQQTTKLTEQELYALANKINKEEKEKEAKVENGKLIVKNVLKG